MKLSILNRKVHYWASLAAALPVIVIISTGLLLQLKKQLPWVQPAEQRGSGTVPTVTMERVLEVCRAIPEAGVRDFGDIRRIDVRPSRGIYKVWTATGREVQIDSATGEVLQVAVRRSDTIEALHDGSWFHETVKYAVFLPAAFALLLLWATGIYLFVLPYLLRARRAKA